mgnify:CR=1 FL=1
MEAVGAIILLVIGWAIFNWLVGAAGKTARAAGRSAVGKGSLSENMELAFKGMGPIALRMTEGSITSDPASPVAKLIETKGLFPVSGQRNVAFVISVFDKTSGEYMPVISAIDVFQEPDTVIFQQVSEVGAVNGDQGFVSWARIGAIVPELLQPPYSGTRRCVAVVRLIDLDDRPQITLGFENKDDPGVVWTGKIDFIFHAEEAGYREAQEQQDAAKALTLKIGMAVAMSDGELHSSEGEILRNFVVKSISPFSEERQKTLKDKFNNALETAYAAASENALTLTELTNSLNEIADMATKYEAVELCFDVLAADGVADPEEFRTVRNVANALELDVKEVESIRDTKIVGLEGALSEQNTLEEMLGIDPNWDRDRINSELRKEFRKWNDRINQLPEGPERESAQEMLDLIARARKKYASGS